jgi:TatD DNase family protein
MQLVDIGVNLAHASFNHDRAQVIKRAMATGVTTMIVTGTSLKSSHEARELASRYPNILFSTAGVHPHNAKQCGEESMRALKDLTVHEEVVAIGECGLDFNRDFSPRPVQEKWFEAQIQLACELHLPLFLHERDAHQRFKEILSGYRKAFECAVVHCFTGNAAELKAYLDMDLHIGITGWICDERRGAHLRNLVRQIPLSRLMIETDAPFLTPRDMPTKPKDGRNEPAFLTHVVQTIAACMGKPVDEVARATTDTAEKFFWN